MRELEAVPVSLKQMWTVGKRNWYWQNSSATLSSKKTILKPLKCIIGVCSRHWSQIRAGTKPVILHMPGSARALPRVEGGIPGQSILLCRGCGWRDEPWVCALTCLGVPSGLQALQSFSLTLLVWSPGSYLLATMTFRKLVASGFSTGGWQCLLHTFILLSFFDDGGSRLYTYSDYNMAWDSTSKHCYFWDWMLCLLFLKSVEFCLFIWLRQVLAVACRIFCYVVLA